MKQQRPEFMDNSSGKSEHLLPDVTTEQALLHPVKKQVVFDQLLEGGFAWDEALKLMYMREHFYENSEVRQRLAEDDHLLFARWLYEHGEMRED